MTESTSEGSTSWRRAILATSSFTVRLGSASVFGAAGGFVGSTFSGTTREATMVLRIRRQLRVSAWTTVVVRVSGVSAPRRPKATRLMGTSVKQNLAILFMPKIAEPSLYMLLVLLSGAAQCPAPTARRGCGVLSCPPLVKTCKLARSGCVSDVCRVDFGFRMSDFGSGGFGRRWNWGGGIGRNRFLRNSPNPRIGDCRTDRLESL